MSEAEPPASWQPEVDELHRRQELARRMGGADNVERQHKAGRLTVRERVDQLLDAASFHETGGLAGKATFGPDGALEAFLPANSVLGTGRIGGRRVVVRGDDFNIEEIIDPRDTRPLLTEWVSLAQELEATRLGPKARGARP